jgi:hypothetical protein
MWSNFYAAGGWGMYPTSVFGFLLIAASVLYVIRPQQKTARLVLTLGVVTFAAGLLGAFVGICNSAHYIPQVDHANQLETLALGCEESLHDVVLSLILVILAGLIAGVGTFRSPNGSAPSAPAAA